MIKYGKQEMPQAARDELRKRNADGYTYFHPSHVQAQWVYVEKCNWSNMEDEFVFMYFADENGEKTSVRTTMPAHFFEMNE